MNQEDIKQIFKSKGIKNTRQRQRVYEYLIACQQPVTADAIYMDLARESAGDETLNLSTVYRILDIFLKQKLIIKSNLTNDNKSTFELNKREHRHHLVCVKCNLVTPITGCPLKGYDQMLSQSTHYEILEHKLEVFGVCPKCQGHS
ncbi:MAG TPA: transcriptional repressor [Clostridiales bacterium UBA8960]|nr:transcriptional repressor [Clostridiales bacterium UBA8960]